MSDLLEMVFQYRRLKANPELGSAGRSRLASLERLFGQDPEDTQTGADRPHAKRQHARCDVRIPATIQLGRRVEAVEVVNLGGGGVRIEPAVPLRPGERAVVRFLASHETAVYAYPVEATWTEGDGFASSMGMPFVGLPRIERTAA